MGSRAQQDAGAPLVLEQRWQAGQEVWQRGPPVDVRAGRSFPFRHLMLSRLSSFPWPGASAVKRSCLGCSV